MTTDFTDTIPGTSVTRGLAKDDLIVIAGAGGFIAGSPRRMEMTPNNNPKPPP